MSYYVSHLTFLVVGHLRSQEFRRVDALDLEHWCFRFRRVRNTFGFPVFRVLGPLPCLLLSGAGVTSTALADLVALRVLFALLLSLSLRFCSNSACSFRL